MVSNYMEKKKFKNININNHFFDSLKKDYYEFEDWFKRKSEKEAYVIEEGGNILGFLYMKIEDGIIYDVQPNINCKTVKIGTFKINAHGTRLGERFIKKALDFSIISNVDACYVTVFPKHEALVDLFMKYGFEEHGFKTTDNGKEIVLIKYLNKVSNNILLDYPLINYNNKNIYLLAIYPTYHTKMFPDSILNNESYDVLEDASYTNSIHKIYVCSMPVDVINPGDIIVIYRTSDNNGYAEYRSVATSICVAEEIRHKNEFDNFDDFYNYANKYSIFNRDNLREWYNKYRCFTIKMTYNAPLTKRLTRQKLADEVGINRDERWSVLELTNEQFEEILSRGGVNQSYIINS